MKNFWTLVWVVAIGFVAQATPLDDKLKNFTDALKASSKDKDVNPMVAARLADMPDSLQSSLDAPGGEVNMAAMIRQLMEANPSAAVQETGKALLAELEARKKARLDDLTAKIHAVLGRVPDILIKAEKPQDLDGILGDLQKTQTPQNGRFGYDQEIQEVANQVTSAYQFVAQWQDYLSYRNSKNTQEALNALRNLMNSRPAGDVVLMPRSEILARISALGSPAAPVFTPPPVPTLPAIDETVKILNGIKTLDDLVPAFKAVRTATNGQGYDFAAIAQMAGVYANAQNGLPISLDLNPSNTNGQPLPELARIKVMLYLYLLPRFIGSHAPAPKPNEAVNDYLKRTLEASEAAQDWETLQLALEAQMKINGINLFNPGEHNFLAGLNQELAGQYSLAVGSYQSSLQNPDNYLPVSVVKDRLAIIQKDHPTEYNEGMDRFLNPPRPYMVYPTPPGFPKPPLPPAPVVTPSNTNAASAQPPSPPASTNAPTATPASPTK